MVQESYVQYAPTGAAGVTTMEKPSESAEDLGVKIEAQFTVGEYEVVILSAEDAAGLDTWLRREKYNIPEGAEPVLRPYVTAGSKFFVAKVDTTKVEFKDGQAMLSPLRFHYDAQEFVLPVRLGLLNSSGTQDLLVHILAPGKRYELIEGELIDKMGQKPPHAYVITVLTKLLGAAFSGRVRIQSSINLPDPDGQYSEPEPDLVVLHNEDKEFFSRHPGPADIAVLIEVADTTFATDRSIKYRLYARAGISEYWIIDIPRQRAVVCRHPEGELPG